MEELASQLGLSTDGTLDCLLQCVVERWTAVEASALCRNADKCDSPIPQSVAHDSFHVGTVENRPVTDLMNNVLVLEEAGPERVQEACDLQNTDLF
jgi:hypothetical protein